jgi:NADPH-dependent glutamate synthase beta subunit-like oxidoreductase
MEQIELRALEDRCIQEYPPACTAGCPIHVDVRTMAAEIGRGDFAAALKTLRKTLPFPGIICRICDSPCQDVCKRGEVGDAIGIRALERACVEHGARSGDKPRQLPRRGKRVAIVGGGLSGLTAAFDLARKGYGVVIFEATDRLGGSAWQSHRADLPAQVIHDDVAVVSDLGVEVRYATVVGQAVGLADLRREFDAVYVATGAQADPPLDPARNQNGAARIDAVTFATGVEGIFAGGGLLRPAGPRSPITSISDGRRAAISIDRYLQQVSLTASRAGEGAQTTRLYTNTQGIAPLPVVPLADEASGYSREEAVAEARRCLQCECMECVKVCPYLEHYGRYPRKYVREIYNNLAIVSGERKANRFINTCSLCGLCAEVCPENLSMGAVCKSARQAMVKQRRMPASAHDFALRDMQFSNSDAFALARNQPGAGTSEYVFFPGCQLCASAPDHTERVYADLRERLGASVGLMLRCCGAPADWAGRADLFESGRAELLAEYQRLGNPRIIVACSSCYQVFRSNLPELPLISLWELYDTIGPPPGAAQGAGTLAVHDPCSTRYERGIQESARGILARLGYTIDELPLSRERTECCSYGGQMWLANPEVARKVVERRIQASPRDYVTYCAMCRDFFAGRGKRTLHLLDLIYGTADRAAQPGPGYSQRHENRARLKRKLLKDVWGEIMEDQASYEAVKLALSDEMRARLEDRLILVEDIQKVIEHAERTGAKLRNQASGRWLAYYKPTSVTYWVEYEPQGDAFVVYNAYSHRMEIVEDTRA